MGGRGLNRLDLVAARLFNDAHAPALDDRCNQLSSQTEYSSLSRWTVPDDEGVAALREGIKRPSQHTPQQRGLFFDQLLIDLPKSLEILTRRHSCCGKPPVLDAGPEPKIDNHASGNRPSHTCEEAGQGLGRTLRSR